MDHQRHGQPSLDPNTIQELEALRSKLWSLQETFASQIAYLKEPKYPFTWPDLLNKFNMLTAKFASLSEDFYGYIEAGSNGTLPKLMLHPYVPTTTEHETNILSVLLRTKLIPDIEKLELETQAALARELAAGSSSSSNANDSDSHQLNHHGDDEQLIKTRYEQWTARRQRHDRIAAEAAQYVFNLVNDNREVFLQRYTSEDEDDEEDEEEEKKQQQQVEQKPWQKMGFSSEDVWRRWKLECAVNYYSSGKEQLPGSDLKKLATNVNAK
ncbi:hypothetical protein BDB00DRAFT_817859 [Zychaea mexicana]|uniref:uncharacterized protein n=1 Tax=Zychaea mexicana TaxID=64656 RepID=UPI0022FE8268|nr:uncharacterized protein BDB00DRAFT_817859 [Zychaea mexicana]KAI9494687.1 hypothetical protein BDB00DRAFT_817859 [Zychaea mexicana]